MIIRMTRDILSTFKQRIYLKKKEEILVGYTCEKKNWEKVWNWGVKTNPIFLFVFFWMFQEDKKKGEKRKGKSKWRNKPSKMNVFHFSDTLTRVFVILSSYLYGYSFCRGSSRPSWSSGGRSRIPSPGCPWPPSCRSPACCLARTSSSWAPRSRPGIGRAGTDTPAGEGRLGRNIGVESVILF